MHVHRVAIVAFFHRQSFMAGILTALDLTPSRLIFSTATISVIKLVLLTVRCVHLFFSVFVVHRIPNISDANGRPHDISAELSHH